MKHAKRILSVTIEHATDTDPDTSHLGEYGNTATSDYSVDRRHAMDCPINAGICDDTLCWYNSGNGRITLTMTWEQAQSVSHSGQCDSDVMALSQVPAITEQMNKLDPATITSELREYGAWDDDELSDHKQNIQRLLWTAGNDISEQRGCNCGESGNIGRHEYRYFNPNHENYSGLDADEIRKYCLQYYQRMESLQNGTWYYMGISACAEVQLTGDLCQRVTSGGLWGIESDSDASYITEIEQEQLAELKEQLRAIGFSTRAIAVAFKDVQHKDM